LALSLLGIGSQGVVWACVYPVEKNSTLAQRGDKKGVDGHDLGLGGAACANAALIGNDDECSTGPLSGGRGIQGQVEGLKLARLGDVAADYSPIQNSVAVQEQSTSRRRTGFTAYVADHDFSAAAQGPALFCLVLTPAPNILKT
jgi:hypothetical protein